MPGQRHRPGIDNLKGEYSVENSSVTDRFKRWQKKTSSRVFVLYPAAIIVIELILRWGQLSLSLWAVPLIPWGYLQFRLSGQYRNRIGGGGPGFDVPPERLVTTGIFALTRNPMYLGQMIYLLGFTLTFRSLSGLALIACLLFWYRQRVAEDEQRLAQMFGNEYTEYKTRVKRWIPGMP